jgi:hypothetical protein
MPTASTSRRPDPGTHRAGSALVGHSATARSTTDLLPGSGRRPERDVEACVPGGGRHRGCGVQAGSGDGQGARLVRNPGSEGDPLSPTLTRPVLQRHGVIVESGRRGPQRVARSAASVGHPGIGARERFTRDDVEVPAGSQPPETGRSGTPRTSGTRPHPAGAPAVGNTRPRVSSHADLPNTRVTTQNNSRAATTADPARTPTTPNTPPTAPPTPAAAQITPSATPTAAHRRSASTGNRRHVNATALSGSTVRSRRAPTMSATPRSAPATGRPPSAASARTGSRPRPRRPGRRSRSPCRHRP